MATIKIAISATPIIPARILCLSESCPSVGPIVWL